MNEEIFIQKLSAGGTQAGKAWKYFLNNYSDFIIKIIRTFSEDYDEIMNKYLFICSHLSANSFNKLKKYKGIQHRNAKFSTWLKVVVSNLCLDEIRSVKGRKRFPSVVNRMTEIEKEVFKLYYWRGFNETQIANRLNDVDENGIIVILGNINEDLKGKRRENIRFKKPKVVPLNDKIVISDMSPNEEIEHTEFVNFINEILEEFSASERVIVKLKYWNDWPAKEIARFVKLPRRKIYSILENILYTLRKKALEKKIL